MSKFKVELVTPNKLLFSEDAEMVVVPGSDGDFAVLRGHSPLISKVRAGVLEVQGGPAWIKKMFIAGGFAEVTPTCCTVLAEEAQNLADLTPSKAQDRLAAAQKALAAATNENEQKKAQQEMVIAETLVEALAAQ